MYQPGTIRLCYRKIIDGQSLKRWDKLVFEDTWTEFRMQAQFYNQEKEYTTFSELIHHVPQAEKLHFLVSAAVIGYLQQLNRTVPDIQNNLGKLFLPFEHYRFEIIQSDSKDKTKHQIAISFITDPLIWHDTIGNQLLLSIPGKTENGELLTEQLVLSPFVSIYSLKTGNKA
jgi:hypothetical protein